MPFIDFDAKLLDFGKAADHVFHRARKNVDAAHHHHIIHPSQYTTAQKQERSRARTSFTARLHEIASAIPDYGAAYSAEIRDYQLSLAARRDCRAAKRVNYFHAEFVFVDMDRFRLKRALKAERANFSRPRMIEAFCAPGFFDESFGAGYARARLAGVDGGLYRRILGEIDAGFFCFRCHVERVRRRGNEHRSAVSNN